MDIKFCYREKRHCLCGAELLPEARRICRKYIAGDICFVRCTVCSSWVQTPEITLESVAEWYDSACYSQSGGNQKGGYLDYFASEANRKLEAVSRYNSDLKDLLRQRADVLEVGCATGSLLSVLRGAGHNICGIDLSSSFVRSALDVNNLVVERVAFLDYKTDLQSLDMIIMLGTISNMHDIGDVLKKTRDLLRPNGLFYFNFPMATSITARIYGGRYWMFAPSVINFISGEGCRMMLRNAGFRIVSMEHDRQKPSLSKLLGHARLAGLYRLMKRMGMADTALPIALPIPGIMRVVAVKES